MTRNISRNLSRNLSRNIASFNTDMLNTEMGNI